MGTEHENPFNVKSQYHVLFGWMRKKQVFTRAELMAVAMADPLNLGAAAASASVTILLSPRKESTRGDCRGNLATAGHLYYMEKLPRPVVNGVKADKKFRLRWRNEPLAARRQTKVSVAADKVEKTSEAPAAEQPAEPAAAG